MWTQLCDCLPNFQSSYDQSIKQIFSSDSVLFATAQMNRHSVPCSRRGRGCSKASGRDALPLAWVGPVGPFVLAFAVDCGDETRGSLELCAEM